MKVITFILAIFIILTSLKSQWKECATTRIPSCQTISNIRTLLSFKGKLYSGGSDVVCSSDYGDSWNDSRIGFIDHSVRRLTTDNNTLFAATTSGVFFLADDGVSWFTRNNGLASLNIVSFEIIDSILVANTVNKGVFTMSLKDDSWVQRSNGLEGQFINSSIVVEKNIFLGTYSSGIFRSSDYGNTWESTNIDLKKKQIFNFTYSNGNIFAGSNGGGVFKSTDSGLSWNETNNGLDTNLNIQSLASFRQYIFLGNQNGVYLSTNNDKNWTCINYNYPFKNVYTIAVVDSFLFVAFSSGSTPLIYRARLADLGISGFNEKEVMQNDVDFIYPTITSENVNLSLSQETLNKTSRLEIFSIIGIKILEFENKPVIDVSALRSGTYLLKAGNKVFKFVKI